MSLARALPRTVVPLALGWLCWSGPAHADRELLVGFHEAGHLVLDDLAGVRYGAGGPSAASLCGIGVHAASVDGAGAEGREELRTTSLWAAPAADVFVIDHVAIGGRLEITHAFGVVRGPAGAVSAPSTTSFAAVPRLGAFAALGDRFGIWGRAGLGYVRREEVVLRADGMPRKTKLEAAVVELDVSLVYRASETFFLRTGPTLRTTLGGSIDDGARGADASVLDVGAAASFGINLEL